MPVGRQIRRRQHAIGLHQRKQRLCLVGIDDLERHPDLLGDPAHVMELVDALGGLGQPDRPAAVQAHGLAGAILELLVEVEAAPEQAHRLWAGRELGAQARRVPCRARRQLVLLEQRDVGGSPERKVIGDAASSDAAADDRDADTLRNASAPSAARL